MNCCIEDCNKPALPKRVLCERHQLKWDKIWNQSDGIYEVQANWKKFIANDKERVEFT